MEGRTLKATTTEGKRWCPTRLGISGWCPISSNGVKVEAKPEEEPSFLMNLFVSWFPMLLLIGVWVFSCARCRAAAVAGLLLRQSRARMTDEAQNTVTFADVAGCDEAKEEVQELVDFLGIPQIPETGWPHSQGRTDGWQPGDRQDPARQRPSPARPKSVLQHFGSDFVEMFVGVGAARVRDMFENARNTLPASSSSMKSTPSVVIAAPASAAATTNGNRRSTRFWWKWMVSKATPASSSSPPPIARYPGSRAVATGALRSPGRGSPAGYPRPRGDSQVHMRKVPIAGDVKADILARGTRACRGRIGQSGQ